MKNKIIIIILIWLVSQSISMGQCQEDEIISTNPNNPINTELSSGHRNINQFNWAKYTVNNGNKAVSPILINSNALWDRQFIPVGNGIVSFSSPFQSLSGTQYQYLWLSPGGNPENLDWHWEDGWELMWLNLGRFPNNDEINNYNLLPAHETSPYFVLYNRYTGKLRWFGNHYRNLGIIIPAQYLDLQIRITSTNKNGIFRHFGSYDQALDQETRFINIHSNSMHPNSNRRFYSSDFQLGYDPCMCQYASALNFIVQENMGLNLNIRGHSINGPEGLKDFPNNYVISRSWGLDSRLSPMGGSLAFKNTGNLFNKYAKDLETLDAKLSAYNKIQNQYNIELIELSNELAKNGVTNVINLSEGAMIRVKEHMKNLGDFDENNEEELVKAIMKTADAIMSRDLDFISKQNIYYGDYTMPLKSSTIPTVSFGEMVIGGNKGNTALNYELFTTLAPGSFRVGTHNFDGYNYPIYNKPTGLYALLKTPKLAFGNYVGAVREKNVVLGPNSNRLEGWTSKNFVAYAEFERITNRTEVHAKHVVSQDIVFKLNEQLLYKLNRNLDINDQKSHVLVSFQIELEGNLPRLFHDNNTVLNERRLEVDLSQSNFQILNHQPYINRNQKEKITLQIPWTKIDSTFKHLYGGRVNLIANYYVGTLVEKEFIRQAILPLVPSYRSNKSELLTNTDNLVTFNEDTKQIELLSKTDQLATTIKSIKMKVLTDLTFDQVSSKGGAINTTQVFTYLLYDKDNNIDLIQSNGTWLSNSETESLAKSVASPSLLTLSNEQINTSSPFISFISGNEIWIRAQEVHVEGTITVTPGYKAVFLLPEYSQGLKKLPGASLDSNIQVRLGDNFLRFSSNPITHEATREQVNTFCSVNNEYKAHLYDPNFIPDHDNTIIDNKDSIKKIKQHKPLLPNDASLFPNPNNGNFMVAFERVLDVDGELTLADFSGRIIQTEQLKKGTSRFQVDAHNLSSGIYFATISHKGQKSTHKVMVNRE
jgi:hypothetical protein